MLTYRLPGDPYKALLEQSIPKEVMMSPGQVAVALADLADLAEAPAVPLRVPVGPVAEQTIADRDTTPYDRPFIRA
jgi:hypothetical protein